MEVKVWQEHVVIPTYEVGTPDKNPMFFENRVYQGSSGVVYPNPVIEKIHDEKTDKAYNGLFLENEYLKIMILPELGGRVQMAYDKIKQRHFIYYNQVIKPALVGLCGPWISGGIEFNWPQHHRPSTFEPVDYHISENADGSKTIWVNEVEKMFRTKGMAGFTLYPGKAYLEIKAQLYNRTNLPQTFLWWANPAVKVNDDYQSVFPPDVNAVFDHGKRDVSTFPIATGTYYKVDYSPGTDISRYKNIPVPTSYMAVNSEYNFVGGYEHDTRAGVLHVADHHTSPGKKQWTWGNGDFGKAWDRNLTDEDGPYIELMTGMYTDNQPDFSWLMPNEEKSFTQYFLPYREVGMVKNATKDLLVGMETEGKRITTRIFATSLIKNAQVILKQKGIVLRNETVDLLPEHTYEKTIQFEGDFNEDDLELLVSTAEGKELISYSTSYNTPNDIPEPAKPALLPHEVENNEQLFLTGQHLEQYRHATYSPVPYYEEALKRDPKDLRNNNALGLWYLRRGQFAESEGYFLTAVSTATQRNPNAYDSEPWYNLGLALRYQGKVNEAYNAFFKAAWSSGWQDSAYFSIARIDTLRGDYDAALEHIDWAIDRNARNGRAYMVKVHLLRKLNRTREAIVLAKEALKRDQFNISVLFELSLCYTDIKHHILQAETGDLLLQLSRGNSHNLIEYSMEYAALGLYTDAITLLEFAGEHHHDPMVDYYLAYYHHFAGNNETALTHLQKAAVADTGYCFPNRLEDVLVLQYAEQANPTDARAPYYLGNLWYDKRQYTEAIAAWERAAKLDSQFPTVFRNLGIAAFNKQHDTQKALAYFEKAYSLNTNDARILMELDQLYKRLNYSPEQRLAMLQQHEHVANQRDDIYLEKAALQNFKGEFGVALDALMSRKFHPWEGGEGKVSGQYLYSLIELAKVDVAQGNYAKAIEKLNRAQYYPHNLGEGKLPGAQENDIFYWLGCAYEGLADKENALKYWQLATVGLSEPSAAVFYNDQQPDKIFYQGLAWQKLGDAAKAEHIFQKLADYGYAHQHDKISIDYFAVSLPDLLIFEDDMDKRNFIHCNYMAGLGYLGLHQFEKARQALQTVLKNDTLHFGAQTHLRLITLLKQN